MGRGLALKRTLKLLTLISGLLIWFGNCSVEGDRGFQDDSRGGNSLAISYLRDFTEVEVLGYRENKVIPQFDPIPNWGSPWNLTKLNIQALYSVRGTQAKVTVPETFDQFENLGFLNQAIWNDENIVSLYRLVRKESPSKALVYVFYVHGRYQNDASNILSLNIDRTPIVFVFVDQLKEDMEGLASPLPQYLEQATLIQSIGHVFGFVNNGVNMATDHEDRNHKNYTSDPNSIMFFDYRFSENLIPFLQQVLTRSGEPILWGQSVLADSKNF